VTFVDLNLDQAIRLRYLLLKLYSRSFTDDFAFAELEPRLEYAPHASIPERRRDEKPEVYRRQALVVGDLETIADSLIKRESNGTDRVVSFGEFERASRAASESREELVALFVDFSPRRRPVLARILIAQACLSQLILATYHRSLQPGELVSHLDEFIHAPATASALAWRDDELSSTTLKVARAYLAERLEWVCSSTSWINVDRTKA